MTDIDEIRAVAAAAERLYGPDEIDAAISVMAGEITAQLATTNPVLLGVPVGGMIPLGLLAPRLAFPLEIDYIHATRYCGTTSGGALTWIRQPPALIAERTVLIVDDVLDEGITLRSLVDACHEAGARNVLTAVLVDKAITDRPGLKRADFTALNADNRYLFGYGMDYKGYLRNADGIYAVREP